MIFRHSTRPEVRVQIDRYDVNMFGTTQSLYVGALYIEHELAQTTSYTAAGSIVPHAIGIRTSAYSEQGLTRLMYKLVDELKQVRL